MLRIFTRFSARVQRGAISDLHVEVEVHRRMTRRREAFDEVAELYREARPLYPVQLIQDLVDLCGIDTGTRVLEIGPGTGQLTLPMAERGARITAIELGPHLAKVARRQIAGFPLVEIIIADFDRWALPDFKFDVVAAATAFHWLDPRTRVAKCAAALRPGGKFAVVHTNWGVRGRSDPFFEASRVCFESRDPEHDAGIVPPLLENLSEELSEVSDSRLFVSIQHRRYTVVRTYSASQYVALLSTFSNVRGFPESARTEFLHCIRQLIDREFGGSIERTEVYDLWVSERRTSDDPAPHVTSRDNARVEDEAAS